MKKISLGLVLLGAVVALGCAAPTSAGGDDVLAQTKEFISYNESITLTPDQKSVFQEALSALPAPCCSQFTAATCCCKCNMARTIWGLSKFLIAEQKQGAEEVKSRVSEWIQKINPDGFSGKACFNGGCDRPFRKDGCGGMRASAIQI